MEEVRVGFIGCGNNAKGHMRRLVAMDGVQVVAVSDLVEEAAQSAAEITGGRAYTDFRRMLDEEKLDAVYLSIPVFAHGEPEREIIARKLPFFVEKPVAINMETAHDLAAEVAKAGVITCVGYQLRYMPHSRFVQSWLSERSVSFVEGHYWCGTGRGKGWHVQMTKSGGQLVEQATHTIDLFRYFVGEVDEVFSYQANRVLKEIDSPDVYAVSLRFANGAIGSFSSVWHGDPADWTEANQLKAFVDTHRIAWSASGATITPEEPSFQVPQEAGASIDQVFIDAVRTNDPSLILTPYDEGVRSLAVSLAANESARTGRPVKISELM